MGILKTLRSVASFSMPTLSRHKRRVERAANIADFRLIAKSRLPHGIFDYIDGAAEDEITMRRNAEAFQQYEFVPRILGSERSRNASSIVMVSSVIVERSDAVFGLGASFFLRFFFGSPLSSSSTGSGGKTSVM